MSRAAEVIGLFEAYATAEAAEDAAETGAIARHVCDLLDALERELGGDPEVSIDEAYERVVDAVVALGGRRSEAERVLGILVDHGKMVRLAAALEAVAAKRHRK